MSSLWFFIVSAYTQFAQPYYTYDAYGSVTGHYSAGAMHGLCVSVAQVGGYTVNPANSATTCANAASAEANKGHLFLLAIVFAVLGVLWMRKRMKRYPYVPVQAEPHMHNTACAPPNHYTPPGSHEGATDQYTTQPYTKTTYKGDSDEPTTTHHEPEA